MPYVGPPMKDRIIGRSRLTPTLCWEWTGRGHNMGYGRIMFKGKRDYLAHRASYEVFVGPVPEGLELDHLCRNRLCVNPAHLEPVTHAENVRRGGNALKTHCPRGHPYDVFTKSGRKCRTCKNALWNARRERKINALRTIAR